MWLNYSGYSAMGFTCSYEEREDTAEWVSKNLNQPTGRPAELGRASPARVGRIGKVGGCR